MRKSSCGVDASSHELSAQAVCIQDLESAGQDTILPSARCQDRKCRGPSDFNAGMVDFQPVSHSIHPFIEHSSTVPGSCMSCRCAMLWLGCPCLGAQRRRLTTRCGTAAGLPTGAQPPGARRGPVLAWSVPFAVPRVQRAGSLKQVRVCAWPGQPPHTPVRRLPGTAETANSRCAKQSVAVHWRHDDSPAPPRPDIRHPAQVSPSMWVAARHEPA